MILDEFIIRINLYEIVYATYMNGMYKRQATKTRNALKLFSFAIDWVMD